MPSTALAARPPWGKPGALMAFGRPLQRISVDQYHQMLDAGVFSNGERCELIRGAILEKLVPQPPHAYTVDVLSDLLKAVVGAGRVVRSQQPITTSDSEPEPDVAVAIGTRQHFKMRHPIPDEIELVVEVSDSTLREDRSTKLELYAESGINCFWIVNLVNACIEVHTLPRGAKKPCYRKSATYHHGDSIPVVLGGKKVGSIPVDDILP